MKQIIYPIILLFSCNIYAQNIDVVNGDTFIIVQPNSPALLDSTTFDSLLLLSTSSDSTHYLFWNHIRADIDGRHGSLRSEYNADTFLYKRAFLAERLIAAYNAFTLVQDSLYHFQPPSGVRGSGIYETDSTSNSDSTYISNISSINQRFNSEYPKYKIREFCINTFFDVVGDYYSSQYYDYYELEDLIEAHLSSNSELKEHIKGETFDILKNK